MKAVFAHDHIFYQDINNKDKYYSKGSLKYTAWERYLKVFDSIYAIGRIKKFSKNDYNGRLNLSSGPDVDILGIPSLSGPINFFKNRREAKKKIEKVLQKSDALIARVPSEIGFLAVNIAEKNGIPWAVEVVSCAWDGLWNYGNLQGKIYAPILTYRTKLIIKKAKFALYVTNEFLQKRYPCSGKTVSCSNVQLPDFDKSILENKLELIKEDNKIIIGLIGNVSNKLKGIGVAIKAMKNLKRQGFNDFELRILGGGNSAIWNSQIEKMGLKNNIKFCGTLPSGNPVFNWLDDVHLYIQPSYQEGLPRATIEAMGRACPVIGSTAGGIPELLDNDCLHKPGDDKKLTELIIKSLENNDWTRNQAIRNFNEAKKYTENKLKKIRYNFFKEFASSI